MTKPLLLLFVLFNIVQQQLSPKITTSFFNPKTQKENFKPHFDDLFKKTFAIEFGEFTSDDEEDVAFKNKGIFFYNIDFSIINEYNQNCSTFYQLQDKLEKISKDVKSQSSESKSENLNKIKLMTKKNKAIVLSGGAAWAFFNLYFEQNPKDIETFTLDDLKEYQAILNYNFKKIELTSKENKNMQQVLKFYDRKELLALNRVLINALENISTEKDKKFYFSPKSYFNWYQS
jgi:hypothetical protein